MFFPVFRLSLSAQSIVAFNWYSTHIVSIQAAHVLAILSVCVWGQNHVKCHPQKTMHHTTKIMAFNSWLHHWHQSRFHDELGEKNENGSGVKSERSTPCGYNTVCSVSICFGHLRLKSKWLRFHQHDILTTNSSYTEKPSSFCFYAFLQSHNWKWVLHFFAFSY